VGPCTTEGFLAAKQASEWNADPRCKKHCQAVGMVTQPRTDQAAGPGPLCSSLPEYHSPFRHRLSWQLSAFIAVLISSFAPTSQISRKQNMTIRTLWKGKCTLSFRSCTATFDSWKYSSKWYYGNRCPSERFKVVAVSDLNEWYWESMFQSILRQQCDSLGFWSNDLEQRPERLNRMMTWKGLVLCNEWYSSVGRLIWLGRSRGKYNLNFEISWLHKWVQEWIRKMLSWAQAQRCAQRRQGLSSMVMLTEFKFALFAMPCCSHCPAPSEHSSVQNSH
jgi:hypothetical protein